LYNKKEVPWVKLIWNAHYSNGQIPHVTSDKGSFWWRDVSKNCDMFRGIAKCKVGDGSTVLFWLDLWNDNIMHTRYPRLYTFAKNKNISVAQFLTSNTVEKACGCWWSCCTSRGCAWAEAPGRGLGYI